MADGKIIIDTSIDSSGAESGLASLSGKLSGLAKGALVGITAATVAVGGLVKASVEQYAQYEQLTGGVETLFKTSSNVIMDYADNAYKTAGMSANEYMRTITGFSASLLQGLGGDTKKAAEIGNMAVVDMSDNANKMGTSMESIQNSYQGFAKQNFTMLDNLKLGYGGTKEEMQRLLVDAEKLTGIKYDISNFSDVISAIHEIQNEIGITGTTAKEASSTIEGSLKMTTAAWSNLLTNMAFDDADFDTLVGNLVDSASAFGENILPRIEIAINGVAQLIEKLLPPIMDKIPGIIISILPGMLEAGAKVTLSLINGIITALPELLTMGIKLIGQLATGIGQALPNLIPVAVQCITSLLDTIALNLPMLIDAGLKIINGLIQGMLSALPILMEQLPQIINNLVLAISYGLPQILQAGIQLLQSLVDGIVQNLPVLMGEVPKIITTIVSVISENLPTITESAISIMLTIIDGLIQSLPQLIDMLPQIITTIVTVISENLPQIIQAGIQILLAVIYGLANALPQLATMVPQLITTIINTISDNLPQIISAGIQIIAALTVGLLQAIPQLVGAIPDIVTAIFNTFTGVDWADIGINILKGIGTGMISGIGYVVEKANEAAESIKDSLADFFDIHSPSRLMRDLIGRNIVKGIGVGLKVETPTLLDSTNTLFKQLEASVDFNTAKTTASIAGSANRAANVSNSTTIVTESDNGPKVYIDKFIGNNESNVVQLAQEIAFLDKRKPN